MAILEMIPPEYWRQLRRELNALNWDSINSTEEAARQQARQAEQEHRAAAFDEAIRRKQREYNTTPERREKNREASRRHYQKVKTMRLQNTNNRQNNGKETRNK